MDGMIDPSVGRSVGLTGSMMTSESSDSPMRRMSPVNIPVTFVTATAAGKLDENTRSQAGNESLSPTGRSTHQRPPLAAVVDHALHRHFLGQDGAHLRRGRLEHRVDQDKVEVLGAGEGQLEQLSGVAGLATPVNIVTCDV